MQNWSYVAVQALWILGLSILLAAVSYAYYQVQAHGTAWRESLAQPILARFLTLGGFLFFAGLALADDRWWAALLFGALAILTLVIYLRNRRAF